MEDAKQNKNVLEFLTIAAEFCAFLEQSENYTLREFADKALKMLSLLYLKVSVLPEFEIDEDGFVEKYVTEQDWNLIHTSLQNKFGEFETYFDVTEPRNLGSGETVNLGMSEAFADIYQDLRDFIQVFREGVDEAVVVAVNECRQTYREYWGVRVLGLMQELHLLLFGGCELGD